jgi:hypothetical protein
MKAYGEWRYTLPPVLRCVLLDLFFDPEAIYSPETSVDFPTDYTSLYPEDVSMSVMETDSRCGQMATSPHTDSCDKFRLRTMCL